MFPAPPVVVDADVLLRNVDYQVRRDRTAALSDAASLGAMVFAASEVHVEVLRHLPDIAKRRGVALQRVTAVWAAIASRIRFVTLSDTAAQEDIRLTSVDPKDLPTARLACVLAPVVLCSDNQKHFRPFFLNKHKVDPVAIDLRTLAQLELGLRGFLMVPLLTVESLAQTAKALSRLLGRSTALVAGIGLVAGAAVAVGPDRRRSGSRKLAELTRELGPPLAEFMATAQRAGEQVQGVTVPPGEVRLALNIVARKMLGRLDTLATSEIAELLADAGIAFPAGARHATATRAWLASEPCFVEGPRGHWSFGSR